MPEIILDSSHTNGIAIVRSLLCYSESDSRRPSAYQLHAAKSTKLAQSSTSPLYDANPHQNFLKNLWCFFSFSFGLPELADGVA